MPITDIHLYPCVAILRRRPFFRHALLAHQLAPVAVCVDVFAQVFVVISVRPGRAHIYAEAMVELALELLAAPRTVWKLFIARNQLTGVVAGWAQVFIQRHSAPSHGLSLRDN